MKNSQEPQSIPLSALFHSKSLPGFYDYAVDSLDICDSAGSGQTSRKAAGREKKGDNRREYGAGGGGGGKSEINRVTHTIFIVCARQM